MNRGCPGADITSERLRKRDWWEGPELFVVVDDYDLMTSGTGMGSTLDPLLPLLAQGALHRPAPDRRPQHLRRDAGHDGPGDPADVGAGHARRCCFSYPKEEGKFLGEAKPRQLPPGRAQLVTRRGVRLMQTGFVSDTGPMREARW